VGTHTEWWRGEAKHTCARPEGYKAQDLAAKNPVLHSAPNSFTLRITRPRTINVAEQSAMKTFTFMALLAGVFSTTDAFWIDFERRGFTFKECKCQRISGRWTLLWVSSRPVSPADAH
jgi:hypothetical protein